MPEADITIGTFWEFFGFKQNNSLNAKIFTTKMSSTYLDDPQATCEGIKGGDRSNAFGFWRLVVQIFAEVIDERRSHWRSLIQKRLNIFLEYYNPDYKPD